MSKGWRRGLFVSRRRPLAPDSPCRRNPRSGPARCDAGHLAFPGHTWLSRHSVIVSAPPSARACGIHLRHTAVGERLQEVWLTPPGTSLRARGRMMKGQHDRRVLRILLGKEIILRILAYGLPITIGLSGSIFGWWKKLATGGCTNRNRRRPCTAKFWPPPGFLPKPVPPTGQTPSEWRQEAHRGRSAPSVA